MCEKHRAYLIGHPFTAKTDHRALIHLQKQPHLSSRQVSWVAKLQEYDIKIEYIPGQLNNLADLLSRSPAFQPLCHQCRKAFTADDPAPADDLESNPNEGHDVQEEPTAIDNDAERPADDDEDTCSSVKSSAKNHSVSSSSHSHVAPVGQSVMDSKLHLVTRRCLDDRPFRSVHPTIVPQIQNHLNMSGVHSRHVDPTSPHWTSCIHAVEQSSTLSRSTTCPLPCMPTPSSLHSLPLSSHDSSHRSTPYRSSSPPSCHSSPHSSLRTSKEPLIFLTTVLEQHEEQHEGHNDTKTSEELVEDSFGKSEPAKKKEKVDETTTTFSFFARSKREMKEKQKNRRGIEPGISGCEAEILTTTLAESTPNLGTLSLDQQVRLHLESSEPDEVFANGKVRKNWTIRDGLYYYGGDRMYIPLPLRLTLLSQYHDNPTGGHQGSSRTLEKICRNFFWPSIREDTVRYVTSCDSCQRHKPRNSQPEGLLVPLAIPDDRFDTVAIDFMSLPKSKDGFDSCFIIVDKLTKLVSLTPTTSKCTAFDAARIFVRKWFLTGRGLPNTIISDRDPRFISSFWSGIMKQLEIKLELTTARHQQANGQAENIVKLSKDALRAYSGYNGAEWSFYVPSVEFALNDSISSATGFSPFRLAFGTTGKIINQPVAQTLDFRMNTDLERARVTIATQQDRMVRFADQERSPARQYVEGDLVMLERDGINWPAESASDAKLLSRRLGPLTVISSDASRNNVTLRLPLNMKIHPVFHTSLVSLYKRPEASFPQRVTTIPVDEPFDPETEYEVDDVIDHRLYRRKRQLLLRWKGYGPEHDWWSNLDDTDCPDALQAYLERKACSSIEELFGSTAPARQRNRRSTIENRGSVTVNGMNVRSIIDADRQRSIGSGKARDVHVP